ncbi:MAG: sensor histidine kinase, partial [Myxococcales bacterium]
VHDVAVPLCLPWHFGERVELVVEVQGGLPEARIDERAFGLAVINLVDNALKYATGTRVVRVSVGLEGAFAAVRVTDQGPGVLPEDRERIFERFVRGTTARLAGKPVRGSGIGLALVKHIAQSHGGRAWVEENSARRGSTFVFTVALRGAGVRAQ